MARRSSILSLLAIGCICLSAAATPEIAGCTGHHYQLQRSDDRSGPWQDIVPAQPGTGAELIFVDPSGAAVPKRFYRVSVNPGFA